MNAFVVFRTDGDSNKKRTSNTPSPDIMLRNMEQFVKEWKDVKSGSGKNLFTLETFRVIENLKQHMTMGCLSDIPPDAGTNRNERFHSQIKLYFNRSRIGILLAYALMTVIIHSHNSAIKMNGKYVSRPIIASLVSPHAVTNIPPIGITPKLTHKDNDMSGSWEVDIRDCEMDIDKIKSVYKVSLYKFRIAQSLASINLSQLQKNVFQFQPFSSHHAPVAPIVSVTGVDFQRLLSESGLTHYPVLKDGNCFFTSVAMNLWHDTDKWTKVLQTHSLLSLTTPKEVAHKLQTLFVAELLGENFSKYHNFMEMNAEDFKSEAKRFLDDGYFSSNVGDAMPLALATALSIHIIIITNEPHSKRMFVTPEVELVLGTVFLVYEPVGPGHYDAALPFNKCDEKMPKEITSCSCGVNSADQTRKSCIPLLHYNTQCKCYKQSQSCTSICRCKNCANPCGERRSLPSKRKRTPHSLQIPLPNSKKFAEDRGESVVAGVWSEFETIVVLEIFCFHENQDKTIITKYYNDVVFYSSSLFCLDPLPENVVLREKSIRQVEAKLRNVSNKVAE